jgi:hypothetical protein
MNLEVALSAALGPNPQTQQCLFMFMTTLQSRARYNCYISAALFTMYSIQSSSLEAAAFSTRLNQQATAANTHPSP